MSTRSVVVSEELVVLRATDCIPGRNLETEEDIEDIPFASCDYSDRCREEVRFLCISSDSKFESGTI